MYWLFFLMSLFLYIVKWFPIDIQVISYSMYTHVHLCTSHISISIRYDQDSPWVHATSSCHQIKLSSKYGQRDGRWHGVLSHARDKIGGYMNQEKSEWCLDNGGVSNERSSLELSGVRSTLLNRVIQIHDWLWYGKREEGRGKREITDRNKTHSMYRSHLNSCAMRWPSCG